jgi:hypothetical protein
MSRGGVGGPLSESPRAPTVRAIRRGARRGAAHATTGAGSLMEPWTDLVPQGPIGNLIECHRRAGLLAGSRPWCRRDRAATYLASEDSGRRLQVAGPGAAGTERQQSVAAWDYPTHGVDRPGATGNRWQLSHKDPLSTLRAMWNALVPQGIAGNSPRAVMDAPTGKWTALVPQGPIGNFSIVLRSAAVTWWTALVPQGTAGNRYLLVLHSPEVWGGPPWCHREPLATDRVVVTKGDIDGGTP